MGGSSSTESEYTNTCMPQVRLSARAQSDLARLHSFLLSKNITAVQRDAGYSCVVCVSGKNTFAGQVLI